MKKFYSNSLDDTNAIAKELSSVLKTGDIITYYGGMGMGKTTFTSALLQNLGTKDYVSSPTFAIMNEYRTDKFSVYHFDMYRITSIDDLYGTGFFDYLDGNSVLIIEWSENIDGILNSEDEMNGMSLIKINIENGEDENSRVITIDGGERL